MLSGQYSQYSPSLPTANQLRQPRAIVLINDIAVIWTEIKIVTTTFYVADTYTVDIPLSSQPLGFNIAYLSKQSMMSVKIYVGFPINPDSYSTQDLQLLMVGDCDEMTIDPLRMTVTFSGRDLTSRFIDKKTYAKYANQTASNIVTNLAQSHGLNPIVTSTQGNVGTFYEAENTLLTKETTEWDLMTFLAQQYNYVVFVQQNNLIFEPKPTAQNSTPYILSYQPPATLYGSPVFNGMNLTMMRCFTVAKDVTVKIRVPYSPTTGKAFTASAGKKNPSINSSSAGNQVYTYTYPGLTNSQALSKAQQLLSEITLNELKISATVPGDNLLTKSSIINLIGTGSQFDQIYYTDTVTRTLNYTDGYLMEIEAKNSDVNSQVLL